MSLLATLPGSIEEPRPGATWSDGAMLIEMSAIQQAQWLSHVPVELATRARGMRLCGYLVALEAMRRGLDVRFHRSGGPFGDWVPDNAAALATLYSIRSGDRVHWFHRSLGDANSRRARAATPRKAKTKRLLQSRAVPTPEAVTFKDRTSLARVLDKVEAIGLPLVVKPLQGSGGRGVVCGISTLDSLEDEVRKLVERPSGRRFVAERHVAGEEYRVFVVGGRVVAASRRWSAHVVGDGRRTIRRLIEDKNYDRTCNPHLSYRLIREDKSLRKVLGQQGFTVESVPPVGARVFLRRPANLSLGGEGREALDELAEEVRQVAITAVEAIPGLAHAGVDVIVDEASGVPFVLEVNCRPSLGMHVFPGQGTASDVPAAIVDYYFPETVGCRDERVVFDLYAVWRQLESSRVDEVDVSQFAVSIDEEGAGSLIDEPMRHVRVRIQGSLRGMDERVWARNLALRNGLTGEAARRFDGSLDLSLAGPEPSLTRVLNLIQRTPRRARGWTVDVSAVDDPAPKGFYLKPDTRLRRMRRLVGRWRRYAFGRFRAVAEKFIDLSKFERLRSPLEFQRLQRMLETALETRGRLPERAVDDLIRRAHDSGRAYRSVLEAQQRLVYKLSVGGRSEQGEKLFSAIRHGLYVREKAHKQYRAGGYVDGSFRFKVACQEELNTYLEKTLGTSALPRLCRKVTAYRFADGLDVSVPAVYQRSVRLHQVEPRDRFVVKPQAHRGAVGVRGFIRSGGEYRDVFHGGGGDWDVVLSELNRTLESRVVRNRWMTEELILRDEKTDAPSDDFKFYMFYGRIGCILHIRRWPQRVQRWYGAEWKPLETGKYTESESDELAPPPAAEALASAAVRLSAGIPHPFVRVDLLSDGSRAVLNELTRAPGDYDAFADDFDQHLGELWRDAEARLHRDLVAGIAFPAYRAVLHLDESGGG